MVISLSQPLAIRVLCDCQGVMCLGGMRIDVCDCQGVMCLGYVLGACTLMCVFASLCRCLYSVIVLYVFVPGVLFVALGVGLVGGWVTMRLDE